MEKQGTWSKLKIKLRAKEEYLFGKQIIESSKHTSPDFLIIGAAKAGTTSLFQYLAQHPEVIPAQQKEILYFAKGQRMGLKKYLENFPLKNQMGKKLTFEGSPSYMYYEPGLQRISHLYPKMKLIILLRDPIKRAFSQWTFHQDSTFVKEHPRAMDSRSFDEAIHDELDKKFKVRPFHQYLYRSLYSEHLKKVFTYFSKNQVLILDFDHLKSNPKITLKEVTDFLGIAPVFEAFNATNEKVEGLLQTKDKNSNKSLKAYNVSQYKVSIEKETEEFLKNFFEPYDKALTELTGKEFNWMK